MLEKFHVALQFYSLMMICSFLTKILFNKVTFVANEMGILGVDFDKINLRDDDKFLKHDPDTIIHVRLLSWRSKFEKRKLFKDVSKELIPVR